MATFCQGQTSTFNPESIMIEWRVEENNYKGKVEFLSAFTLRSKQVLPAKGWSIFFNFPRTINKTTVSGRMKIEHINGDFYRLLP